MVATRMQAAAANSRHGREPTLIQALTDTNDKSHHGSGCELSQMCDPSESLSHQKCEPSQMPVARRHRATPVTAVSPNICEPSLMRSIIDIAHAPMSELGSHKL
jgi:hypothetical protein